MTRSSPAARSTVLAASLLLLAGVAPIALAATPASILAKYEAAAGAPGSPERGKALFTTDFKQMMGWSCSSCHTTDPTQAGKDESNGKALEPMAPAANPKRFTDPAKVEFRFSVNCPDVVGRKCTPQEKADVLAWLLSLKTH